MSQSRNTVSCVTKARDALVYELNESGLDTQTDVECPICRVDIVTDSEIIIVRNASYWWSAISLIIACQLFFTDKTMRIHLCFSSNEDKERFMTMEYDAALSTIDKKDIYLTIQSLE